MKFFKVIVGVTTHKQIVDFINDIVKHLNDLTEDVSDIPDLIEKKISDHKPNIEWGELKITENPKLMSGSVDVYDDNYTLNLTVPYCECLYSNLRFKFENNKIWVSFNDGKDWYDIMGVLPEDNDGTYTEGVFGAIKFKTEDGCVWVSYDGGFSWENIGSVSSFNYEADFSNVKLKIDNNSLYLSIDGGSSWENIGSLGNNSESSGTVDLSDLQFKIEGTNLKVSTNGGNSWSDLGRVVGKDGSSGESSGGDFDTSNIVEFTNEEDTTGVITSGAVRIHGGLSVNKTIWANSGIWSNGYVSALGQNTSSDERLKDVLYPINISIEDIAKAPNIEFKWKSNGNLSVGSIAQYWKNVLPNAVHENSNGYLEMEYGNIALSSVISLANEVLELRETVKKLQKELNC